MVAPVSQAAKDQRVTRSKARQARQAPPAYRAAQAQTVVLEVKVPRVQRDSMGRTVNREYRDKMASKVRINDEPFQRGVSDLGYTDYVSCIIIVFSIFKIH